MKKFFINFSIFLIIALLILKGLDVYYTRYIVGHKNLCEKSDWILHQRNQKFDYGIIGNSRVINMADINTIDSVTGKRGINLGLTGSNYAENYLVLKEFLKSGNELRHLFIQVDMHSLNSVKELTYPFHNYNYMHLFSNEDVMDIFKDNNPMLKIMIWKYVPFARYMEFSNKYVFYKIMKGGYECRNSEYDLSKGSKLLLESYDSEKQPFRYSYWTTRRIDETYLYKLIGLSTSKGIEVITYSAPVYSKYKTYLLGYDKMIANVINGTDSLGIRFLNFNNTLNTVFSDTLNFSDNIHLNALGTKKFSLQFSDSIKAIFIKNEGNNHD